MRVPCVVGSSSFNTPMYTKTEIALHRKKASDSFCIFDAVRSRPLPAASSRIDSAPLKAARSSGCCACDERRASFCLRLPASAERAVWAKMDARILARRFDRFVELDGESNVRLRRLLGLGPALAPLASNDARLKSALGLRQAISGGELSLALVLLFLDPG